jgi:putative transposase
LFIRTLSPHEQIPLTVSSFAALEEDSAWTHSLVQWYNLEHRHRSPRFVTSAQNHSEEHTAIPAIRARRVEVYCSAQARHPERWNAPFTRT